MFKIKLCFCQWDRTVEMFSLYIRMAKLFLKTIFMYRPALKLKKLGQIKSKLLAMLRIIRIFFAFPLLICFVFEKWIKMSSLHWIPVVIVICFCWKLQKVSQIILFTLWKSFLWLPKLPGLLSIQSYRVVFYRMGSAVFLNRRDASRYWDLN